MAATCAFDSTRAMNRSSVSADGIRSGFEQEFEAAVDHPLGVERHGFRVHHVGQARILHHLGVDAVPLRARLVHDIGEHHGLAGLLLDAARKRSALAPLHVVRDALPVFEGAVLLPNLARSSRQPAVGLQLPLRNRHYETIDVYGHAYSPWVMVRGS